MDGASWLSAELSIESLKLVKAGPNLPENQQLFDKAVQYYHDDSQLLYRMVTSKKGSKYRNLYLNDSETVYIYLTKYHSPKYAVGSLAMKLLWLDRGDIQQTNRILLRSPLIKYWTREANYAYWEQQPGVGRLDRWVLKWKEPYYEAVKPGVQTSELKTHGEIEINRLKQRLHN